MERHPFSHEPVRRTAGHIADSTADIKESGCMADSGMHSRVPATVGTNYSHGIGHEQVYRQGYAPGRSAVGFRAEDGRGECRQQWQGAASRHTPLNPMHYASPAAHSTSMGGVSNERGSSAHGSYSHSGSTRGTMASEGGNKHSVMAVHTGYPQIEDRPGRVHRYISGGQQGDGAASTIDVMAPPVLPPLESLQSGDEIPFWRPPAVLQREPHYHRPGAGAGLSGSLGGYQLQSQPVSGHAVKAYQQQRNYNSSQSTASASATCGRPMLSAALLAISNTHYQHNNQLRQRRSRHTLASICSPVSGEEDGGISIGGISIGSASTSTSASASTRSMDSSPVAAAALGADDESRGTLRLPPIEPMSIACLVSARADGGVQLPSFASLACKRAAEYDAEEDAARSLHKMARTDSQPGQPDQPDTIITYSSVREEPGLCSGNQVVITCYHAAVAQKSYGGEKRFLCPPPAVLMCGEGSSARAAHGAAMLLSVVREGGCDGLPSSSAHGPLECQTSFNERNVALFKSLHVTGMQKAKSFRLRLDLVAGGAAHASLESGAVAIISKPSKKTAKARNQSTCIRSGALVALFNRINSQTFRTKYLNVDHTTDRWVAQSQNWSPFHVEVVGAAPGTPLYYGAEIVLVESHRSFRSPPMIIRKVERGRLVAGASSPVSQMQKVALQLKGSRPPRFLMADAGHYVVAGSGDPSAPAAARFDDADGSPELTFEPAEPSRLARTRLRDAPSAAQDGSGAELDDAFCWTIVGIAAFTHAFSAPRGQAVGALVRVSAVAHDAARRSLRIVAPGVELAVGELLLGGQPLHVAARPAAEAGADGGGDGGGEPAPGAEPGAGVFIAQLPDDAAPGALAVRRSDGALVHTGWAMRHGAAGQLELAACSLDI